jgi:hypothetical protein
MKYWLIRAPQLLAVAPVAVLSLVGVFLGCMALASVFSTGHILGSLVFGLGLIVPSLMVTALCIAIIVPPAMLRLQDRLAGGVALGLLTGSILACALIYMELSSHEPASWKALLMFAMPLALAIFHGVRLATSKPAAPPSAPPVVPTPLE